MIASSAPCDACDPGDLADVGDLLTASHRSLRDDYQVSCPNWIWQSKPCWALAPSGPG
jgi:galactokinase